MPAFQEPKRTFSFSDARLIEIGLEKCAFAERDETELATVGITDTWVEDLKERILAFGAMPSDVIELAEQKEATDEKNIDAGAVRDKLKELRSAAKRAFGEKSGTFGKFKLKDLDDMSDAELLKAALVAHGVAITYATELEAKGYDAAASSALQTLTTGYVGGLTNQALEVGSRDNAQEARVVEANEIYNLLENELCEAAKSYWLTRSASKHNDYIIYNNESGTPETEHFVINAGEVVVLAADIDAGDPGSALVKNTGGAGCVIHIYYGSSPSQLYTGTGVTLNSGDEQTISGTDPGPVQNYLLAQNASGVDGGLDVTPL